ncbi:MAG TPA: SAM-dependent methyltransferase, partial [Chitinophagaceae bacterium]|nr:SAM-dependent methyltransferase [Chitinophagaceae bacterium]
MYTPLQLVKKYLHYYITANNRHGHGTHSPFIYNFIRAVLMDKKKYPAYTPIEKLRHQLHTKNVADSSVHPYKQQKIKNVFTSMAKP